MSDDLSAFEYLSDYIEPSQISDDAMSQPTVLIFGAGANVGLSIASKFQKEGYKVAAVSRTIKEDLRKVAHKTIESSLTPKGVTEIFEDVEKEFGPPNVVVYNGLFAWTSRPYLQASSY